MRENSLSKKILLEVGWRAKNLLRLGEVIIFEPHQLVRWGPIELGPRKHTLISKGISNLKKCGYLKEERIKNKKKLYLTSKGRIEIIKNILKEKKNKKLRWDGKWRAIIFDIPELSKKDRDFLRRELYWMGFKELQKSVWVFPFDIEKELTTLLKLWKIEFSGDIRFLTIEKMDDKDLREYFNLR